MNNRCGGQMRLRFEIGLYTEGSIFRIVFARQTAETFAFATASSSAAGLLLHHIQRFLDFQSREIVTQMVANDIQHRLRLRGRTAGNQLV